EGFFRDIVSIAQHAPDTSIATLAVAAATFVVIAIFEKFVPRAPAPLVAVAGGIAAAALLGLQAQGVSVVGEIPGGFPALTFPDPSLMLQMWRAAPGLEPGARRDRGGQRARWTLRRDAVGRRNVAKRGESQRRRPHAGRR